MPSKRPPQPTDMGLDDEGMRHGARALVLKPFLRDAEETLFSDPNALLAEAAGLAEAIALNVIVTTSLNIAHPTPATLLGSGQVEKIGSMIEADTIELAIVDHPLTPVQQRNLERDWKCKVIDRTGLILEIFGARARTYEGKLQVELAALSYQKSRLVRSWTHLERQRGGFGFLGGPGESQLEIDRRLITTRISRIKTELEQVRRTRGLQREARQRAEHPTIALVGYTNAGKSTLFNKITGATVLAQDMLFATLDPSMRGLALPSGREAILSDTVGFISDLPTSLVEAFRATLEEVQLADVILHVRDVTHPESRAQREVVLSVLADLGIEADDPRLVEVLNKADLLPEGEQALLRDYAARTTWDAHHALDLDGLRQEPRGGTVAVSALTGQGLDDLLRILDERLAARRTLYKLSLPLSAGAAMAWLYGRGQIISREDKRLKTKIQVALDAADFGRFISKFGDVADVED